MIALYVGSTGGFTGKTLVSMGLGHKFQKDGFKVGYIKPVGILPVKIDNMAHLQGAEPDGPFARNMPRSVDAGINGQELSERRQRADEQNRKVFPTVVQR